jgi:cell division protein WhiA
VTAHSALPSDDVRSELAAIAPARRCDRLAEVSALFHSAGSIHLLGRRRVALHLDVGTSAIARRAFALLRHLEVPSEIRTYARQAFDRSTRYQLHVEGDEAALVLLTEAGVVDRAHRPLERPPRRVTARSCCRGAYLRGAFLGGGTLAGRRSPHLELRTATLAAAEFLRLVGELEGIRLGVAERPRHALAYAKSWDAIETLFAAAGATDAVLALEERAVVAATRAQANRLANADHANLVRTSRAAQRQLDAARRLRAEGRLERLPPRLREAAALRLRNPTLPLRELARRADPPATKAGIQRRLARIVELGRA